MSWIELFLTNRKQSVQFNDYLSDWVPVLSGIPQGSVLGLLLFILYINTMPSTLLHDPKDKTSTVKSDKYKNEVLQEQYCIVLTLEDGTEPLPNFDQRCNTEVPAIDITEEMVLKKLLALNASKSAGPDSLRPRLPPPPHMN